MQIVDIIKDYIFQFCYFRIHIPGNGNVDQYEGSGFLPFFQGQGQPVPLDDVMGGAGGGNDDIRIYRVINKFIESYGRAVEFFRQFLRMVETAVGYKNGRGSLVQQMPGGKLAHLAGPDDQDIRLGQIADDFHGKIYGRGRHADTAIGNLGAGADLFAGRDGLIENGVEQGRSGAGHTGQMIGVLYLAKDLSFSYD